jgi:hypothetical protein
VNVNRPVFVAVEEEPISVLFENLRHSPIISELRIAAR